MPPMTTPETRTSNSNKPIRKNSRSKRVPKEKKIPIPLRGIPRENLNTYGDSSFVKKVNKTRTISPPSTASLPPATVVGVQTIPISSPTPRYPYNTPRVTTYDREEFPPQTTDFLSPESFWASGVQAGLYFDRQSDNMPSMANNPGQSYSLYNACSTSDIETLPRSYVLGYDNEPIRNQVSYSYSNSQYPTHWQSESMPYTSNAQTSPGTSNDMHDDCIDIETLANISFLQLEALISGSETHDAEYYHHNM